MLTWLRRVELPVPTLPSIRRAQSPQVQKAPQATTAGPPQAGSGAAQAAPIRSAGWDADPWGSPELHKGHNHSSSPNGAAAHANGDAPAISAPQRTTSSFTTQSEQPDIPNSAGFDSATRPPTSDSGWGGYSGSAGDGFNPAPGGGEQGGASGGFGAPGDDGAPNELAKALRTNRIVSGVQEVITVNVLEEKEGVFMFQHRNYEVTSIRRGSKVIRRYSDFVWLLDCLHKRYPFRQLPLLPPKRVASELSCYHTLLAPEHVY